MFCKKCGKKLRPGENFCTQCGTPAFDEEKKEAPYPGEKVVKPKKENEWKKEEKKEKTILIILSILIVFLVVAIVAGIISLFATTDKTDQPDVQKNEIRTEVMKDITEDNIENESEIQEDESVIKQEDAATVAPDKEENTVPAEQPQQTVNPSVSIPQSKVPQSQTQITADPDITAPVQKNDQFIISDSNTRYITNADLNGLSEWEIRIARNEIYARRGRIFKSDDLQQYFNSKDWYHPSVSPDQFDNSYLNNIEIDNLKVILNYEKAHNLNQ